MADAKPAAKAQDGEAHGHNADLQALQTRLQELELRHEGKPSIGLSSEYKSYQTSLTGRYCSKEMSELFSRSSRHKTWRQLWLYLAESERDLGIDTITPEALEQMRAHIDLEDADFELAAEREKKQRHDVMAHVAVYGARAPAAAGIIHYGATSCYVTDNTELILMQQALNLLLPKLAKVIQNLADFAMTWKSEPTLAYTHLQPAQLNTVGKRATHWIQDLMIVLEKLEQAKDELKFRGAQGTTGTQASFLEIFQGDGSKCDELNRLLCKRAGFSSCYDVSTQTYSRLVDLNIANAVCLLGPVTQRICQDIRHLATWKEIEEPFEKDQIGSSAMAFKRNPQRSERMSSLARELMSKPINFANTLSDQWFERTLDDSAIRRIDIPEMFLLADAIAMGLDNITNGLVVYPSRIAARVQEELPFIITETLIMRLVKKGKSRQEAHEEIRVLSHEAARAVKVEGKANDLVARIKATEFFRPIWPDLDAMMRAELYIGRSADIVENLCGPGRAVDKKLQPYKAALEGSVSAELHV